ncbi:hypothetical protein GCM10009557_36930 [Virgisporangium ochraceum]|uniref:Uncharacterized protein n=1 Tax=Virgisporangium ochraceum TaxID=65505 RepID=A0A8J4EC14_9ACTN|nr:hypothetical protein Voc01_049020 [Virgisporangium ochraceum]
MAAEEIVERAPVAGLGGPHEGGGVGLAAGHKRSFRVCVMRGRGAGSTGCAASIRVERRIGGFVLLKSGLQFL